MDDQDNSSNRLNEETASVVAGLRAGDTAATRQVRRKVSRIVAFRGYGVPHADRQDLEQVIQFQIWQAVQARDFDTDGFWGFLAKVAARRCIDWRRTRRSTIDLETIATLADSGAGPVAKLLQKERSELARRALAQLPDSCRELIELHTAGGKTYAEIAVLLGKSEGSLRVRMHRCIGHARRIISRLLET